MKVIEATWEKANLGFTTAEVQLESVGDLAELARVASSFEHVVAKFAQGDLALAHALEDAGYRFCEVQFSLFKRIEPADFASPLVKYVEGLSLRALRAPHEEKERDALVARISDSMFDTDRISLDPRFGPAIGARRYRNWMASEAQSGRGEIHAMVDAQGNPVGLILLRENGRSIVSVLGGLFPEAKQSGFGLAVATLPMKEVLARGLDSVLTSVSSNNLEVMRLYLKLGFSIRSAQTVFRIVRPNA